MIVRISYNGKLIGQPMNDLHGEKLLDFIQAEMDLGRTVTITPDDCTQHYPYLKPGIDDIDPDLPHAKPGEDGYGW